MVFCVTYYLELVHEVIMFYSKCESLNVMLFMLCNVQTTHLTYVGNYGIPIIGSNNLL